MFKDWNSEFNDIILKKRKKSYASDLFIYYVKFTMYRCWQQTKAYINSMEKLSA